jgi:hypothetical protein
LNYLYEEIIGPSNENSATPIDIQLAQDGRLSLHFKSRDLAKGPWKDAQSGQEILSGIRPKQRYGAGILTPEQDSSDLSEDTEINEEVFHQENSELNSEITIDSQELDEDTTNRIFEEEDVEDEEESPQDLKSIRLPSSMGFSCFIEAKAEADIQFEVSGAWYEPISVTIENQKFQGETWYLRKEFKKICFIEGKSLLNIKSKKQLTLEIREELKSHLNIELGAFIRPWGDTSFLITFTAVNRSSSEDSLNKNLLFQTELGIKCKNSKILPYPSNELKIASVEEEIYRAKSVLDDESTELLFRNYPTFGIGHNCSVDWKSGARHIEELRANSFPVYEGPSITPDIQMSSGTKPNLRMCDFYNDGTNMIEQFVQIANEYEEWIERQSQEFLSIENHDKYANAFAFNTNECRNALNRIRRGISILENNENALLAFKLMNESILIQQVRSKLPNRTAYIENDGRIVVSGLTPEINLSERLNSWRPFQIAFILSVLESIVNEQSPERDLVDLIFFPTGGGKTEAYLGVIAFNIIYRRILNKDDNGTVVLMRYTLRLLTTQQFLRAASLICALEDIRSRNVDLLGTNEISIGAWLGGDVTPNTRQQAIKALNKLKKNQSGNEEWNSVENPFLVLQCPWCASEFGQVSKQNAKDRNRDVAGYRQDSLGFKMTVRFACPDVNCRYHNGLPLYVIDDDLYEVAPSLVIGTVDKFAMLSWRPAAQKLFGRTDGNLMSGRKPPSLIIQDEFHLISGPLGSMVGHYETVIEDLCTFKENDLKIVPKIISSTATIRRFWAQANAVYGRDKVSLFPPPLLDINDSFFSVWAYEDKDSTKLKPGRLYAGILARGLVLYAHPRSELVQLLL